LTVPLFVNYVLLNPQPVLSPARDIDGKWTGQGFYYFTWLKGEPMLKISEYWVMEIKMMDSNKANVNIERTIQNVEDVGNAPEYVFQDYRTHFLGTKASYNVVATVEGARLSWVDEVPDQVQVLHKIVWEFTFTTDQMMGRFIRAEQYWGDDAGFMISCGDNNTIFLYRER
jgi:hypothetical protein